ncbi:MAG: metallophosphoesterase [Chloroflexota bacterium]|nr:metallophosphoesterase [Anaerolineae bacterium]
MRVLFVTDLHGCVWKYDRLFEAAQDFRADVVINCGDMLPKGGDLFAQDKFIAGYLDAHFAQFDSAGIYYLCYLGNDDLGIFDKVFKKVCNEHSFVICLAQRRFEVGGFEFVGLNWVVDYPFRLKDRCRMDTKDYVFEEQLGTGLLSTSNGWKEIEDWFSYAKTLPTIKDELDRLVRPQNMARSIYVTHMPPYKLGLDECSDGSKVGSKAIYNFLLEYQPKLSLHGHVHESPEASGRWYAKLGDTICIQPGQLVPFTYVTIDLDTIKFDRHTEAYKRAR